MKLLDILGTLILGAIALVAVVFLWVWFWMFILGIFGLFFIVWASGTRFKITKTIGKDKVHIGYLRWFTFTKV
jgi:hypothetical protein